MNLSNDRGAAHREEPELLKSNSWEGAAELPLPSSARRRGQRGDGRLRPSRTLLAMHSCRTTFHSANRRSSNPFTHPLSPSTATNLRSSAGPLGYPEFHCFAEASLIAFLRLQHIHFMALVVRSDLFTPPGKTFPGPLKENYIAIEESVPFYVGVCHRGPSRQDRRPDFRRRPRRLPCRGPIESRGLRDLDCHRLSGCRG